MNLNFKIGYLELTRMKNLTNEQIESVILWMNTWEQLKGTAIPMRFKEDFTKQLQQANVSSLLLPGKNTTKK